MTAPNRENLGPADRIIQSLLTFTDHGWHNRPGMISSDARTNIGIKWVPVTHAVEDGVKIIYRLDKSGKTTTKTKLGVLNTVNQNIMDGLKVIGQYREAGIYPEVVTWFYQQAVEVWKLDNEFAARWASFAYGQEHRDLKVVLAALMLVQNRKGDPVKDGDKIAFYDDDFRDVGEAMMLLRPAAKTAKPTGAQAKSKVKLPRAVVKAQAAQAKAAAPTEPHFSPKELLRIHEVLTLSTVADINRELGFGGSLRRPFLGRWPRAVEKYLRQSESNPKLLKSQIDAGFRTQLMALAQHVGYKPTSTAFFEALRWRQVQADDGRRTLAIGTAVTAAESWEGLDETAVCLKITRSKLDWKRITSLIPKPIGITRAVMAAAITSDKLSNRDLLIYTPTIEDLGLLTIEPVKVRWEAATKTATDTRALNIARNVQHQATKDKLVEAADTAVKAAVVESVKDLMIYFMVDISGSMQGAIEQAKIQLAKFLQAIPPDQLHCAVFNTTGRVIVIKHASAAGVEQAFKGIVAAGGTDYGAGVRALQAFKPKPDQDVLFLFVGDEEATIFDRAVRDSGLNPLAFGFLKTIANSGAAGYRANAFGTDGNIAVRGTAMALGIPCFMIDPETFTDSYAIPRTIRALIAATPVGTPTPTRVTKPRVTLIDQILATPLLTKPVWA